MAQQGAAQGDCPMDICSTQTLKMSFPKDAGTVCEERFDSCIPVGDGRSNLQTCGEIASPFARVRKDTRLAFESSIKH